MGKHDLQEGQRWTEAEKDAIKLSPTYGAGRDPYTVEVYAQTLLTEMRLRSVEVEDTDATTKFFRGSLHKLCKEIEPRSHPGKVIDLLRDSRAIEYEHRGGGGSGNASEIYSFRDNLWYNARGELVDLKAALKRSGRSVKEQNLEQRVVGLTKMINQQAHDLQQFLLQITLLLERVEKLERHGYITAPEHPSQEGFVPVTIPEAQLERNPGMFGGVLDGVGEVLKGFKVPSEGKGNPDLDALVDLTIDAPPEGHDYMNDLPEGTDEKDAS